MSTYIFLWRINSRDIPRAIFHMAVDRLSLHNSPGVTFFKSLGIGAGVSFTPSDADIRSWALLVTFDRDMTELEKLPTVTAWRKFALEEEFYQLSTITSHGLWAKQEPFISEVAKDWAGEVATITRARIRWHQNLRFWRSVPPVTESLHGSDGLIRAIGIGEAPIGLQGTFSHWRSQEDLRVFAYKGAAHQKAIALTAEHNWYAEELFARFAITAHRKRTLRQ